MPQVQSLSRDLVALTKPRVVSLLLLTAVAPMFITDRGAPPLALVLWVLLGGYLMAGGANAINMWFDRDIDDKMSRRGSDRFPPAGWPRPPRSPSARPGGLLFAIFWRFANPLSAWLALGGLSSMSLYTVWLKRSTPQNIGSAGRARSRLWSAGAAVAGRLDLSALYLLRHHLLLTPRTSGAGAPQERRICPGRGPHAPGGPRV
jgi:protoheme IX farnesyltransferase